MKPLRFYEHFACAYGTLWLILLGCSFLIQEHIDAGVFGLCGFPIISVIYAFMRSTSDTEAVSDIEVLRSEIKNLQLAMRYRDEQSDI